MKLNSVRIRKAISPLISPLFVVLLPFMFPYGEWHLSLGREINGIDILTLTNL